jgi:protein-S-isoprenylcysteine O-methyltransferase Ste14
MTDTAGVIAPPPLLFLGGLAVGIGLELLLGSSVPNGVQWVGGALLVVAGVALLLAFERAFSRRGTAVEPWKPRTAIVTDGVYRFTRKERYLKRKFGAEYLGYKRGARRWV